LQIKVGRPEQVLRILFVLVLCVSTQAATAETLDWSGPVHWQTWEEGSKEAAIHGKPMFLLVFGHWCPHCRELMPVFRDPEIARLSRNFVMVHQDTDERPPWLARYGHIATYVPRIFFLYPDGALASDITSGNAQFPYYYQPSNIGALRASMHKGAALRGGHKSR